MQCEAVKQSSGTAGERILGTGIDLVENARFRDVLSRWDERFLARVFLDQEREYCWKKAFPAQHFAGRFAIKEAVAKAFMTGIGSHFGWLDIEVVRNPATGAPSVALHGKAADYARAVGVTRILVSISHTRDYAVASAVLAGDGAGVRG
jgi:holo-[acyl-carrier protein] synthase